MCGGVHLRASWHGVITRQRGRGRVEAPRVRRLSAPGRCRPAPRSPAGGRSTALRARSRPAPAPSPRAHRVMPSYVVGMWTAGAAQRTHSAPALRPWASINRGVLPHSPDAEGRVRENTMEGSCRCLAPRPPPSRPMPGGGRHAHAPSHTHLTAAGPVRAWLRALRGPVAVHSFTVLPVRRAATVRERHIPVVRRSGVLRGDRNWS